MNTATESNFMVASEVPAAPSYRPVRNLQRLR